MDDADTVNRRLTLQRPLRAPAPAVWAVLADMPTVQMLSLDVDLGGGSRVLQTVVVELRLQPDGLDGMQWTIAWRPESHARLLPSFAGAMVVAADGVLRLDGGYDVPLGWVGAAFDALVGHGIARSSVERFLDAFVDRLEAEVHVRGDHAPIHPPPAPPDLSPWRRSVS